MKKYYLLCAILIAAYVDSGYAQTISSQKGLTTAVFSLPAGIIKINLPDDIRPGDMISGTISAEPAGRNTKQLEKNLAELKKYSVDFDGQKFPVSAAGKSMQCSISNNMQTARSLSLINNNGANAGQVSIRSLQSTQPDHLTTGCKIPTHALTAAPLRITGPFDGNSTNTNCDLNGKACEIIAESPRQTIVAYPENAKGIQTLQVQENNQPNCSQQVSGVGMTVLPGKTSLLRGEKTYVSIEITGLQHLPDTALLTLNNRTPEVIMMRPSNDITIPLRPDSISGAHFLRRFDIQSIKTGNFTVNVNLELPEPPSLFASVNTGVNKPPVYADNNGGIELHPLKVDGLKNGMSDVFKKTVIEITGNRASKYPELDGCGNCLTCIQSMLDESKVALVGEIGKILLTHYVELLVNNAGGVLAWVKDKYDKVENAKDVADAIAKAVAANELQVVEFEERMCGYCLVSAIGFYDTRTRCMDAFFYCKGKYNCCTHLITVIHVKYCVNDDGFIIKNTGMTIDVITK